MEFKAFNSKPKIIFILGATGTGKTQLSIDLAVHLGGEVINSDKIQFYKGLNIITNKVSEADRQGIPHHLLGIVEDPNADFTCEDFCTHALKSIEEIINNKHIPIIVGGSNTYIEILVEKSGISSLYDCCFLWLDVSNSVLCDYLAERVDQMVKTGLIEEVKKFFSPQIDYTRGINRAIGVQEMEPFLMAEYSNNTTGDIKNLNLLRNAIERMKENTVNLAFKQREKILRFKDELGWDIFHLDATGIFNKGGKDAHEWKKIVLEPSLAKVMEFLG